MRTLPPTARMSHRGLSESPPAWSRMRLRGAIAKALPYVVIAIVVLFATSGLWRFKGLPVFGDWVPPDRSYLNHIASLWNQFERNGSVNVDLRTLPWLGLEAVVAGAVGSPRFLPASDLFVVLTVALPAVTSFYVAQRRLRLAPSYALIAALLYGFNPWVASQVAPGHFGIVLGYGLLPLVCATAFGHQGRAFALRTGLLIAAAVAVDIHLALLCLAVLVIGRAIGGPGPVAIFLDLASAAALTILLSAYWLLPTVLGLSHLHLGLPPLPVNPAQQATLAQMADPIHVLTTRSNWWQPFSDGLYTYGILTSVLMAVLVLVPSVILVQALGRPQIATKRSWQVGAVLVLAGTLPQVFAHVDPSGYAQLARLPLGGIFRDVSDLTPLYIVGLALLAISARPMPRLFPIAAAAACLAALLPWMSGDLRGDFRPALIDDGQLQAIQWLNTNASIDTRALWIPLDSYVKFSWSRFPVNDPVRFWTDQRVLNSIGDPAYDFSPSVTNGLINLEAFMARKLPPGQLASLLAHAGVRYVVSRPQIQSSALTADVDKVLASSEGIRLAHRFGAVNVYEVLRSPRPDVNLSDSLPVLFDGGWDTLARASALDDRLERTYVPVTVSTAGSLLQNGPGASIVVGSSIWEPIFALGDVQAPPNIAGRARYPFDPGLGYAYDAGEVIAFKSSGIAAVRLLAGAAHSQLTCLTGGKQTAQQLVTQPGESLPRWYVMRCGGTARLTLMGRAYVQSVATATQDDLRRRVELLSSAMSHPNSGYVFEGINFAPDFVSSVPNSDHITGASVPDDPIALAAGSYQISDQCLPECPGAAAELTPLDIGSPAASLGLPVAASSQSASRGVPLITATIGKTISVRGGLYQLRLVHLPLSSLESLTIQRLPISNAGSQYASPLSQGVRNLIGPAAVVEINEAPGPWSISTQATNGVQTMPADVIGSAYLAGGDRSSVSFEALTSLQIIGSSLSIGTIAFIALLLLLGRLGWVTGRHR